MQHKNDPAALPAKCKAEVRDEAPRKQLGSGVIYNEEALGWGRTKKAA